MCWALCQVRKMKTTYFLTWIFSYFSQASSKSEGTSTRSPFLKCHALDKNSGLENRGSKIFYTLYKLIKFSFPVLQVLLLSAIPQR